MLQTTFFLLTLVLGIFAITPDIPDGVQKISMQVTKLDDAATAFSSTNNYMDAFAIHKNVLNLVYTINEATEFLNATPKPISVADAHAILDGVEALNPTISHAVDQIISKNTFFRDQPIYSLVYPAISALVKQDLNSVQGSASKFLATTVGFVPADMVPQAESIQGSINDAVAKAIDAYS